ncbi:unnamed protein product [Heligmosomoides polygyrus]|uniref:DUF5641 domain-containing protein n=1 Tax=Heligmosomoides polygyrus TaxID=6339 RepID=A0A3P8D6E9_HELPZ|nr:unnamed protein product [Heligmosomoides polygyrus]
MPSLPSMSSVGAVKAQIMKAVNALRQQLQEVDQSLFEPVRAAVGPEEQLPSNLHRKSAVADTTFKIMHLVMKLEKRWQQARQYASEQQSSHGGDLMEEFRAHWNSNNCEEAVQEAERIVVRMQDAMVKLTTTASRAQNTSPSNIDAGDDIDNPAQGSQTPPKRLLRLGEGADSTIMMSIIADKFPLRTKEKLGEHRVKATTWNITALLAALDSVIHELEVMEDANLLPAYPTYSSAIQQRPRSPHKERTRRTTPTRSNRYQSPSHDRIVNSADLDEDRDVKDSEIIQQYYNTVQIVSGLIHPRLLDKPRSPVTTRDAFVNNESSQEQLVCHYSLLRDSLENFWNLWHRDYLQALAERTQLRSPKNQGDNADLIIELTSINSQHPDMAGRSDGNIPSERSGEDSGQQDPAKKTDSSGRQGSGQPGASKSKSSAEEQLSQHLTTFHVNTVSSGSADSRSFAPVQSITVEPMLRGTWAEHVQLALQQPTQGGFFHITGSVLKELLRYSSAILAQATRMISVLDAHRHLHVLHYRMTASDEEDKKYVEQTHANVPETMVDYTDTLRWWRDTYSQALAIDKTEDYLRRNTAEETLQPERRIQEEGEGLEPTDTTITSDKEEHSPEQPTEEHQEQAEVPLKEPELAQAEQPPTTPTDEVAAADHKNLQSRNATKRQNRAIIVNNRNRDLVVRSPIAIGCLVVARCLQHRGKKGAQALQGILRNRSRDHLQVLADAHSVMIPPTNLGLSEPHQPPQTKCHLEGHHRVFCVSNPRLIPDIDGSRFQFYERLARATYRPCPPGVPDLPKHELPRKQAEILLERQYPSGRGPTSARLIFSPRPEASFHKEEASDHDSF